MKFSVFFPVKPKIINQVFGEVAAMYTALNMKGHNGIDFGVEYGQPVYATHDGFAYFDTDSDNGHIVAIRTADKYDFEGVDGNTPNPAFYKTVYAHLSSSPITYTDMTGVGQPVKAGDIIGYAGNTGLVSPAPTPEDPHAGTHLHFGIKPIAIGEEAGTWDNILQGNGYNGCVDPEPYFNGEFAADIQIIPAAEDAVKTAGSIVSEIAAAPIPDSDKATELSKVEQIIKAIANFFNI